MRHLSGKLSRIVGRRRKPLFFARSTSVHRIRV